MLNVEEIVCPELTLANCHVKEAMRAILHTVVVCRSIGGTRPIEPCAVHSEALDVTYMKTDEDELERELEQSLRQFGDLFEAHFGRSGSAQIVLSFYVVKTRKQSIWNILVGSDEKIVFEQWRVPVTVQPPRRHLVPAENMREEEDGRSSAARQVQDALRFAVGRSSGKVDHLPPPPTSQASYKFEVSFAAADGRSLGAGLLPQGLGSALSQTVKHLPHIS
mmetsp:Transcript_72641/g.189483  ORF Transcript_72641/g.189483 Transcript_72641/m.189483 type:complete len:221 (+) Transcript_72641:100-762(+)